MKLLFIFFTFTLLVFSHSGKLDSHGGHTDKDTGKYHYHTPKKGTNINPFHSPIRIQILKYGYPYSWGQEFAFIERCNAKKKMLERQNKGSDYSYICAIK
jgi:hypothetical protein